MTKKVLYLHENISEEHPIIQRYNVVNNMVHRLKESRELNESIMKEILEIDFEKGYSDHPLIKDMVLPDEYYCETWESVKFPESLEKKLDFLDQNIGKVKRLYILDYETTEETSGRENKIFQMYVSYYDFNDLFGDVIMMIGDKYVLGITDCYNIFDFELSNIEECTKKMGEYWELENIIIEGKKRILSRIVSCKGCGTDLILTTAFPPDSYCAIYCCDCCPDKDKDICQERFRDEDG